MFVSKNETIRRLRDKIANLEANESARTVLPRSIWVGELDHPAEQRAVALQAARTILGDITTEELLDAADFIDSGIRYDEDEDDRPDQAAIYDEAAEFFNVMGPPDQWVARQAAGTAGSDDRLPRRDVGATFPLWEESRRRAEEEAINRFGSPQKFVMNDRTARFTPHSAPLVPLDDAALDRLEELRRASTIDWGVPNRIEDVGEETERVTTTPLVPNDEDEADRMGESPLLPDDENDDYDETDQKRWAERLNGETK